MKRIRLHTGMCCATQIQGHLPIGLLDLLSSRRGFDTQLVIELGFVHHLGDAVPAAHYSAMYCWNQVSSQPSGRSSMSGLTGSEVWLAKWDRGYDVCCERTKRSLVMTGFVKCRL